MLSYLTPEQVKFYEENGYIKINPFTKEEVDRLSEVYDELFRIKDHNDMDASWKGKDIDDLISKNAPAKVSVKSLHNLHMLAAEYHKFLMNDNLLDALEVIMKTKNIALHHTKAHLKPPENGSPYLMHQDYPYFPFKHHSMVAAFLHLDDTSPENGGLCVYPGSHKLGPMESKRSEIGGLAHYWLDQQKFPIDGATPVHAKRGEVVIFSYLLVHGSYLNLSSRVRRMFLAQIMSADDEPLEDTHMSPGHGLMLRGINRGNTSETQSWRRNPIK